MIVWPILAGIIVNPHNKAMEEVKIVDGVEERYFSWDVSQNFRSMMFWNGFSSMIVMLFAVYFLKEPTHMKAYFSELFKAYWENDEEKLQEISKTYYKSKKESLNMSISKDLPLHNVSINMSQLERVDSEELLETGEIP